MSESDLVIHPLGVKEESRPGNWLPADHITD